MTMADNKTLTGCRDNLHIDSSRCLRMRYSESNCCRCVAICPHGAVTLDSGLAINPALCRGCLACTTACPAGAVEQQSDFAAVMVQLAKIPEPILGCLRTDDCAHASLPCLGGLSAEHLLALFHSLSGKLTLNLSLCHDCPNSAIIAALEQRLETIATAGLSAGGSSIVLAESAADIHFCAESVDRRSFFKSLSSVLLRSAAGMLTSDDDRKERRSDYAVKRIPFRRALLNSTRCKLSSEGERLIQKLFDFSVSFETTCSCCQGCVAICPTGALQAGSDEEPPAFDRLLCTGCGLCAEFCLEDALLITAMETGDRCSGTFPA